MLTQALLPHLRAGATAADPARVIMIGSIDGIRVPAGDNYSYSASKAGIHMLGRHLASHLAGEHITVNSIAPGPFESKMMAYMLADEDSRRMVEASVPRGRIGTPEDVAGTVIYPRQPRRRVHDRRDDSRRRWHRQRQLTARQSLRWPYS